MQRTVRKIGRYRRRAAVIVQVAVASTVVLGMGALALDVGTLYTAQTELQVSADAAALAAAGELAGTGDVQSAAISAADTYAGMNKVLGMTPTVLADDVEFGRAFLVDGTDRFQFEQTGEKWDAVRVTVWREQPEDAEPRPLGLSMAFAQVFGSSDQALQAHAAAVLVPRDIAVVIDLSNSMGWDSQLRYWNRSDGGNSNLRDVWCALDGPEPSRPYVPTSELESEYANDTGPTIGVMDVWGDPLVPGQYNPATDPGLCYLPRNVSWIDNATANQMLVDQGYDDFERWVILTNETEGYLTPPVADDNGFTSRVVWKKNSSYGRDRVTIYLTSDGEGAALSHLALLLPPCAWSVAQSTATSQDGYPVLIVNPDPKTGLCGLKYDDTDLGEGDVVETEWFSFEVPSSCALTSLALATKAGQDVAQSSQAFKSVDPYKIYRWRYRVGAVLGLAHWDSGMDGSGGDGNGLIDGGEISWSEKWNPCWAWSWTDYVDYPRSIGSGFTYRYGLKTFTNFLLERQPEHHRTCDLWKTPEQPLRATKDAVNSMIEELATLDTLDQISLQIFAQTARVEVDLSDDLYAVSNRLYEMQTGHYDRFTNIGGGLGQAIYTFEREGSQARPSAHKVIVLMSDGQANVDTSGNYVGDGAWSALEYARQQARYAAEEQGYRLYTVSVGYYVDRDLMQELAQIGHGEEFYASGDPSTYTAELREIFETLGGRRPVALIE